MRADAVRNRQQILAAARRLIGEQGAEVSMDAIAVAAGVAVGTLYRHHPTKADLVAAVVEDSVAGLAELSEQAVAAVATGADPGEQLRTLFRAVAERHSQDRALKAALAALGRSTSEDPAGHPPGSPARRVGAAVERLLQEAGRHGDVRSDLTVLDLTLLLAGVPDDARNRERYTTLVLAALACPG